MFSHEYSSLSTILMRVNVVMFYLAVASFAARDITSVIHSKLVGLVIVFQYINNGTGLYEDSKYYDLNPITMFSACLRCFFCEIIVPN